MEESKEIEETQEDELKDHKKILITIVSNLTIVAVLLYYLGWRYWQGYFEFFNIGTSLVDISFERILITGFGELFSLLIVFSFAASQIFENKNTTFHLGPTVGFMIFMTMLYSGVIAEWFLLTFAAIGVVILIILKIKKFKYKSIPKSNYFRLILIVAYIYGIYYYKYLGEVRADRIYRNFYYDIQIYTLNDGVISGKFIYYSNEKYFLITNSPNLKKQISAIENSNISKVNFLKKPAQ